MEEAKTTYKDFLQPRDAWDALSMKGKAEMIGVAVRNGITNLNDIRDRYNEYAEGGSKEEAVNTDEQYFTTMEKVAEDNYQKWGFSNPDEVLLHALNDNTYNYRGFYGKYPQSKANADTHWTDEFKSVYHPTFSNESIYSGQKSQYNPLGLSGGFWSGNTFVPMAWQLDANEYKKGGSIHIAPSKKGTFTAAAKKHGKSVQAFASQVLAHPENYSPAMRKKANFARNAAKWHEFGGKLNNYNYGNTFGGGGLFGNETVDTVASFLPILGTAEDAYQFYQDPSWSNAGWLALSLGSDIFTGGMASRAIKAVRAANKAVDAANAANKAARRTWEAGKAANTAQSGSVRGADMKRMINSVKAAGATRQAAIRRADDALIDAGIKVGVDQGFNTFLNATQNDMLPTFDLQQEQKHGLGGNLFDGTSQDSQQMDIAVPDATYVASTPLFHPISRKEYDWEDAALHRTNQVYSNYDEAKDEPLSLGNTLFRNGLRWIKDNIYEDFPSGVSNCTLSATQWVDPQTPVKGAKSIHMNPERFNYTAIDSADVVPGNLIISKIPDKDSYHTMMVTGFAGQDSTVNFRGKNYSVKKGEPLMTYSRGGHDASFIQRNMPLSVYTANSDGHTQNLFYRYNYPREVFLPEIIITPNKKKK